MLQIVALIAALSSMRTPGTALPAASLPSLTGGNVALRSLVGTPSVVVVTANWCDPCHADMPSILAAAKRNPHVRFVAIDELESAAQARAFATSARTSFTTLSLTDATFSKPGVTDEDRAKTGLDIPAVYVLNARGIVVKAFVGGDIHVGEKVDATLHAIATGARRATCSVPTARATSTA